ncbi:DUF927 domain-containing protein [Geobacter sp. SVR]|uniref:DUF927 domain-containing protein n=1 Tax=Geobacter sp. SVR TaxID=2495594 RepID=UPI00143EF93C|nr:DUF927 domain-containing protein [Geobacter sp. SVR]BCS55616.1 hypothetical protein GSVR_39240 [Geobacter sp. SVR]GCF83619.1 hypothetical protein GSbR_02190 [Geobacter sp. SVR]
MTILEDDYTMPEDFGFDGECLIGPDKEGGTAKVTTTPIIVTAFSRTADNSSWNLVVKFEDRDGRTHKINIPSSELLGGGLTAVRQLVDNGLGLCPGMEKSLVKYLQCCHPVTRLLRVVNSGWVDSMHVFVLPSQVFGKTLGETIAYEPEQNSKTVRSITRQGALEEWQENIAAHTKGNSILLNCILLALTGPLLKILGLDGGGFHIYGHSSRGKTTALQVAASVWGCGSDPAIDSVNSFAQRWNSTANALEAIAAVHSDLLTALDELGTYNGTDLGVDVYTVAGGQGKSTLTSNRKIRQVRTWRGNILSNGEKSMRQAIEEGGRTVKAGQMLRIIDIRIDDIFPSPPEGMTTAEFANHLKHMCSTYYGTAGPAFMEGLVAALADYPEENIESLRADLEKYAKELTPENARPEQARAFRRFAALRIAGELAIEFGVLSFEVDDIKDAVIHFRDLWLRENQSIGDADRALLKLQSFLIRNHSSFPSIRDTDARISNARAFRNPQNNWFLFTDDQLMAATGGSNIKDVVKELRSKRLLIVHEAGRLKIKQKLASAGDQWVRFYGVNGNILNADLDGEETEATRSSQETGDASSIPPSSEETEADSTEDDFFNE